MATTWNPSDKDVSVTLSGANLIATSAGGNDWVRATPALTGKAYYELTVTNAPTEPGLSDPSYARYDDNGAIYYYSGNGGIYGGGQGGGYNIGGAANGDVIGFAVDVTAEKFWIRRNGGDWLGEVIGLQNPATGLGGISFSGFTGSTVVPRARRGDNGSISTLNAGASAFQTAPPSGFVGPDAISGYTLTAAVGSFALAGQAAGTLKKSLMTSAGGAFTLAGQAAGGLRGLRAVADVGAFTLAGQAAGTLVGRVVAGATGTFSVAGQAAGTLFGRNVAGATGAFALAGQDAALTKTAAGAYTLTAAVGAFVFTGVAAGLRKTLKLTADQGAIAFNGNAAGLVVSGGPGEKVLMINVGGVWHTSTPFVRVGGAWKQATPYVRDGGVWK